LPQGQIDAGALRLQEGQQRALVGRGLATLADALGEPGGVRRGDGLVRDDLELLSRQAGKG
jgi:hypothetical protein